MARVPTLGRWRPWANLRARRSFSSAVPYSLGCPRNRVPSERACSGDPPVFRAREDSQLLISRTFQGDQEVSK
jgi:hypothetical protein